jgi:hypothetical protein
MVHAMASTPISRAMKRSAQLSAQRVPQMSQVERVVPEHVLKARESFTFFCTAMGKPPAPHMLEWHRELVTGDSNDHLVDVAGPNTCLLSPRGPLDLDTKVLTPDGWRPLRDIRKKDLVYDSNGLPTRVEKTVTYGKQDCWEVEFSDGTTMICDETHKWLVRRVYTKRTWQVKTLADLRTMAKVLLPGENGRRRHGYQKAAKGEKPWLLDSGRPRWEVPVTRPVRREAAVLPVDPYVIGVLLGRGATTLSPRFTSNDPDVIDRVEVSLPPGCELRANKSTNSTLWGIAGNGERPEGNRRRMPRNPILIDLEVLGFMGTPRSERKIPNVYLQGSISQRVALLQGMLDGSGTFGGSGTISVWNTSKALHEGLLELVRSLGGVAKGCQRVQKRDSLSYHATFNLPVDIEPFHTSKKSIPYQKCIDSKTTDPISRTIVDIRPAGKRNIGCITVESPLHDFLIEDYVVSCNSAKSTEVGLLCAWLIGRHTLHKRLLRILYVSFNIEVARGKSLAIKHTIKSLQYQEIFPMVRLSKTRTSDELWSIDYDFAGIDVRGEDAFTVACAGLHGAITSKRSNFVVLDDLIKSKKSISNPEVRREMEANWNSVIVPTMFEGARAVALGTRFHFDDMFATTFTERKGWKVMVQSALLFDDEGQARSYWPEMWGLAYLLDLQRKDRVSFAYQYMNNAIRSTELGISPELFVKGQIPDTFDTIGVGMDLSSGLSERNDYTVFMLGGRDGDKAYIIDKRRIRCMGNIEKVEALCELLHEWNLLGKGDDGRYLPTMSEVTVWPEEVSYQKSFQGDFRRIVFDEWGLTNLRVSPVKGIRGDKLARFRGVMGLFETGKVIFNKYRDFQIVFDEIANLGHASHDDCADALQILLDRMYRQGRAEIEY